MCHRQIRQECTWKQSGTLRMTLQHSILMRMPPDACDPSELRHPELLSLCGNLAKASFRAPWWLWQLAADGSGREECGCESYGDYSGFSSSSSGINPKTTLAACRSRSRGLPTSRQATSWPCLDPGLPVVISANIVDVKMLKSNAEASCAFK